MVSKKTAAVAAIVGGAAAYKIFEADLGSFLLEKHVDAYMRSAGLKREVVGDTRILIREGGEQDLFVVPGFTLAAKGMSEFVAAAIPRNYRVIVIELPFQGESEVPGYAGDFPGFEAITGFVQQVIHKFRKSSKVTLVGYSLGGGITLRYASKFPEEILEAILIAPAFPETLHDDFKEIIDAGHFRKVHGYETLDEALHFFTKCGLGVHPEVLPPALIMKGLVKQRGRVGPGYYARYGEALFSDRARDDTLLSKEILPLLPTSCIPFLLLCGSRDDCIDCEKCRPIAEAHPNCKYVVLQDCGHFGGPKGKRLANIFSESAAIVRQFLSAPPSKL